MLTQVTQNIQKLSAPPGESCFTLNIPCFTHHIQIELVSAGPSSFFFKDLQSLENCFDCLKKWPKEDVQSWKRYENWKNNNYEPLNLSPTSDPIACYIDKVQKTRLKKSPKKQSKCSPILTKCSID